MNISALKNRYDIVGKDPKFHLALEIALQVAPTDLPVLIIGESGVGKEVFSKIIHQHSKRKHHHFLAINCGALPEGTINSELFGHEKGAFTGATDNRKGYFEMCNEGSLFLDEIAEMPLQTQAFLLRILESGEYLRVGSSVVRTTNVRVIAATNKNLRRLVQDKKFREDLYYRLNAVSIAIPALRERKEDIRLLFKKFAYDFSEKYHSEPIYLNDAAEQILLQYPFDGNVRELKNVVERLSILSPQSEITPDILERYIPNIYQSSHRSLTLSTVSEPSDPLQHTFLFQQFLELKKEVDALKNILLELLPQPPKPVLSLPQPPLALPSSVSGEVAVEEEPASESLSLEQQEREMIVRALKKHKGKRKDAAKALGISARTLYRKIKDYNLEGGNRPF